MSTEPNHVSETFVFINANPAMVFLSMMQADLKECNADIDTDLLKRKINKNKEYTVDSFKALEDLKALISQRGKSYITLESDNIKEDPTQAVKDVLDEWRFNSDDVESPPSLASVVSGNEEDADVAEYVMAHPDPWVSEHDKEAPYFRPSVPMSEEYETSQRIGKIQDFFNEDDHEKVSRKLGKALDYIRTYV